MSWIKSLWDKVVNKTSTSPTLTLVEEEPTEDIADLFESVCAQLGLGEKFTKGIGATQKFVDWYDGPADEESVRQALPDFRQAMGGAISAKMSTIK